MEALSCRVVVVLLQLQLISFEKAWYVNQHQERHVSNPRQDESGNDWEEVVEEDVALANSKTSFREKTV